MLSPSADFAPNQPPLSHGLKRTIVLGVLFPMLLGALDSTIVATTLPTIAASFNDLDNIAWVVTAYMLTATVTTPLYGKLSDIYGRRTLLLCATSVLMIGSLVSALAPTLLVLIVGRAIQGVGGGGTLPLAQTVIAEITTPMERPRYQGYTSAVFMIATVGGPGMGGLIAQYLHWSVVFWINLPLGAVALGIVAIVLRRLPRNDRPHRVDVLGAGLMTAAGLSLMLALTWGGRRFAWTSPEVAALILGSAVLWALFGWRVSRAPEPFIPLSILRDRIVRNTCVCAFFAVGTTLGLTILIPLYLKIGLGLSASLSGIAVIALQTGVTISSAGSTYLIVRMVHYRRLPLVGLIMAIALLALLMIKPVGLPLEIIVAAIALIGAGIGPIFTLTSITVQNVIAARQLGIATGVLSFFRSLGGTFIVTVFGAILLGGAGAQRAFGAARMSADPDAFRWVFATAIGCLVASAAALLRIEERPFRGPGSELMVVSE